MRHHPFGKYYMVEQLVAVSITPALPQVHRSDPLLCQLRPRQLFFQIKDLFMSRSGLNSSYTICCFLHDSRSATFCEKISICSYGYLAFLGLLDDVGEFDQCFFVCRTRNSSILVSRLFIDIWFFLIGGLAPKFKCNKN